MPPLSQRGTPGDSNIVVEAADEEKICRVILENYGKIFTVRAQERRSFHFCPPQKGIPKSVRVSLKPVEHQSLEPVCSGQTLPRLPLSWFELRNMIDSASHCPFEPFHLQRLSDAGGLEAGGANWAEEKLYKDGRGVAIRRRKAEGLRLEVYEGQHLVQIKLKHAPRSLMWEPLFGDSPALHACISPFLATRSLPPTKGKESWAPLCLPLPHKAEAYGRGVI